MLRKLRLHLNMPNGSSLILGARIAAIIGAVLAIFHQDLAIIANDALQTESMSARARMLRRTLQAKTEADAQKDPGHRADMKSSQQQTLSENSSITIYSSMAT